MKHGYSGTPEYVTWIEIKNRCFNPRKTGYAAYGGSGITVCPEWKHSFLAFLKDMGPKPSPQHTIDRINPLGNYERSNCRWATYKEQCENRRLQRDANPTHRHLGDDNPIVQCQCGCGASFLKFDAKGRPRKRIAGHWHGVNRPSSYTTRSNPSPEGPRSSQS